MSEEKKENTAKIDQAQQAKLKAKTETEKKDDEIKLETSEELRAKLSNKNVNYVFRLQKELEKQGKLSPDEAKAKVDALLPEIVVAQRHGQPANGLYLASPVIKADQMLHPAVKPKTAADTPYWQRGLDAALLFTALFMAFYGVSSLSAQQNSAGYGVTSILLLSWVLGFGMAKTNEFLIPNPKTHKTNWPKAILGILVLIVALIAITAVMYIKGFQVINPVLPGVVYLIIAVVAFGIRYWFRRQFNIVGSVFTPAPRPNDNK